MSPFEIPEIFKEWGGILGKGLVAELAPDVAKGALVEILKEKGVNVKKATEWVTNNVSLWDKLEFEEQESFRDLAQKVGRVDWITTNWIIDAIKHDLPSVASLFLGWKKGANWLERQVEIIKEKIVQ